MTSAELAILGLVVEQPRHGYQIEQVIEGRNMRRWTEIGFSSIYYLLKKLEKAGLVVSAPEDEGSGGPVRRVYRPTATGRRAWREESRDALATHEPAYPRFLLGLSALPAFEPGEAVAAFRSYRDGLVERLAQMNEARDRAGPDLPYHVAAMFDHSEALIDAEVAWIDAQIRLLAEEAS